MATNGIVPARTTVILYGTETGTSQDLARELGQLMERLHFSTHIGELDSFPATNLSSFTITIFVLATTGQGEFPSNARKFWMSLLRKKLAPSFLEGVKFALVGLGDTSYPKFNWSARKLEKRLKQLGAKELLDACEADEQGDEGTDGAFLAWSEKFQAILISDFSLPNGLSRIPDDVHLPSKWLLTKSPDYQQQNGHETSPEVRNNNKLVDHDSRVIPGSISAVLELNTRVTPVDHWQDVRFLKLKVSSHIDYFPGDALSILPKNSNIDVEILVDLMRWQDIADLHLKFEIFRQSANRGIYEMPPIPQLLGSDTITIREILRDYLDIKAIPRRSFFAAIAQYTDNDMHRERLLEFTRPEFLDEYYDYATRPRRSILEILQEFDSVKIPYQQAANIFPVMRPRQFSIASGGTLKHSGGSTTFELLIAIVKYRTVIKRIREGVCTKYLATLQPRSSLKVLIKPEGRFDATNAGVSRNHVLVGPGTGIAPLRALLYEKELLGLHTQDYISTILFFGARNSSADYFFQDEWKDLVGSSLHIVTAFSRDQKTKVYVQDKIREHGEAVREMLLKGNATVIVCGSSGPMPKAVREALLDVLVAPSFLDINKPWSRDTAEDYLVELEKKGRYKQETW